MDDDIANVDQYPVALCHAFNTRMAKAFVPESADQMIRDRADVALHARRAGRWETATLEDLPLRPEPHPSATPSPTMAPCRDCTSIPVDTR